jgi:hypothetical protein
MEICRWKVGVWRRRKGNWALFSSCGEGPVGSQTTGINHKMDLYWHDYSLWLLEGIFQHPVGFLNSNDPKEKTNLSIIIYSNHNDYTHMTVNQDQHYKDSITGTHTNTVEGIIVTF